MARSDIDWSSRPGNNLIDLGEEGLSDGDDLTPYVDDHFDSGNQVYIPPGSDYFFDASAISGSKSDCSLVGDPEGVEADRPSGQVRPSVSVSGDVLIENMTLWGEKGELQTRWRIDPSGNATATIRNVNWPDGTVSPSDSQIIYSEGSGGTIRAEYCYAGGHANTSFYLTYSDTYLVVEGCTFMNSNNVIRNSPAGVEVRDTRWFADGFVPQFSQDGGAAEGAFARFMRTDNSGPVEITNLHATITNDCSDPGPVLDERESVNGSINGFYLYNETDQTPIRGFGGLSASNINVSGPGDTDVPWSVDGSQSPDAQKPIWTPEGAGAGGCEGNDDCPRGRVCEDEACVPPVVPIDGDVDLDIFEAELSSQTSIRTLHSGHTGDGFIDMEPPDGSWAVWDLDVIEPGEYEMDVRFSNGDTEDRTCDLIVGDSVEQVTFPSTGGWESWQEITVPVSLPSGVIEFGFETTGADAGQIDTVSLHPAATDPCEGVECGPGEECQDGDCIVVDPCAGVDCGPGEECQDGDCVVVDPCAAVTCDDCETCVDGDCVPVEDPCCGVTCDDGETCEDGDCVPVGPGDPCEDVSCGDCETCVDGDCVPVEDPCCGVSCGDGEVCEDGECVPSNGGGNGDGGFLSGRRLLALLAVGGFVAYRASRDGGSD